MLLVPYMATFALFTILLLHFHAASATPFISPVLSLLFRALSRGGASIRSVVGAAGRGRGLFVLIDEFRF